MTPSTNSGPAATAPERPAAPQRRWALDVLRIVSVIGVVAIHVFGNMVGNDAVHGSARWWGAVVVDLGFVWVVPVFVMISGALILEPRQYAKGPADFYRRRLLRLGPAFVFWPLFYVFVVSSVMAGRLADWRGFLLGVVDGRSYTHLYFLWLIVGLYVAAPVLAAFLRDGGRRRAAVFAGVVLAVTVATLVSATVLTAAGYDRSLSQSALTQWLPYVGFFLAGWALRDTVLRGWKLIGVTAVAVVGTASVIVQYGRQDHLPLLGVLFPISYYGPIVAIVALAWFVVAISVLRDWQPGRAAGVVRVLSDASFGVFLVHFAVIHLVRTVPALAPTDDDLRITVLVWVLVCVISFALVAALRRVPWVNRLV
ncbi:MULTISPECIES: acyltransferase [unclassified Microbacterium]|uniref:acyltransferase n=1 Tax=unclassified Microbacterium TaxID=2609290 RepID=UPI001443E8E1|nr:MULTISPECIES: acyltransferase family protein [unclassified Microbacterium]